MSKATEKFCLVCNDIAFAIHFNALTCLSCRSFFRRAHKLDLDKLSCRFKGNCQINKTNRKCKSCRFKKCLDMGMKRELVFFYKKETPKQSISKGFELTPLEIQLISNVNEAGRYFVDERTLPQVSQVVDNIAVAANYPGLYVSRVIKYCQHFHSFKCLKEKDQITIIKGFFAECMSTRFAFVYDAATDGLLLMENESGDKAILLQIYRFTEVNANRRKRFRHYLNALNVALENDSTMRELFIVNFLFNRQENLNFPEHIRHQYFLYNQLLYRYLRHKFQCESRATEKYQTLMNLVSEFPEVRQIIQTMHSRRDPLNQMAVLNEVFNVL